MNDDNADNWGSGFYRTHLTLTGTVNTAGSTLTRTGSDGSTATFTFAAGRYQTTAGDGAFDTLTWNATARQYTFRDGATQSTELYSATGQLLSATDAAGNTTTFTYSATGLITQQRSASGETLNYDYSGNNLTQIRAITADGKTTTRVRHGYDTSNRLITVTADLTPADNTITDGKTFITRYTYDGASKRLASITTPEGNVQRFTYILVGSQYRLATLTDAIGTTRLAYSGARTTVTDPLGLITYYDFNTAGQLTQLTRPGNQITRYTWDAAGNLTRVIGPDNLTTDYTYDANGNCTREADSAGNILTRSFDSANRLTAQSVQLAAGSLLTTRYAYDATNKGLLRFEVSPEGRVTEHRYDSFGQRTTSLTYAVGLYTGTVTESALATWVASRQASALRTDFTFDARGQLQTSTTYDAVDANGAGLAAGKSTTQYIFDAAGNLLKRIDAVGASTTWSYDGLGRQLTQTNALGQTTLTTYDDTNNRIVTTEASGLITTRLHDKAGRLVSLTQASAKATLGTTRTTFDADNRPVMVEDPLGNTSFSLYDALGNKVADVDPDGTLTEYRFDAADRQTVSITYSTAVDRSKLINAAGVPLLPTGQPPPRIHRRRPMALQSL
jgi:YD repeat-containing protein